MRHYETLSSGFFQIYNDNKPTTIVEAEELENLVNQGLVEEFFVCSRCRMEENYTGSEIINGERVCYICLSGMEE